MYEKNVLNQELIYVRYHKNIIGHNSFFRNFRRITSELDCMCTNYNTLHERSVTKHQIVWHNSNIYICTGEHDDNIIFLHEIDWKIQMNDRHMSLMLLATLKIVSCLKKYYHSDDDTTDIVKLLCLPTSLYKHILDEFEYQVQLQFDICIEPTINYTYPNEF